METLQRIIGACCREDLFYTLQDTTQVQVSKDVISATQEDSMPNLWRRRLAHMSEKRAADFGKEVSHSFFQRYAT